MAHRGQDISAASLSDFEVGVTLGTGSFGRVRFATHKDTTTPWAVKVLKKSELVRLQQVEHVISEKTILDQCKHPFIVHLACTFQDKWYLYMVLEYVVGGEFFTHLRNAGRLDIISTKFYSAQVTLIFEYLHARDFIYRDLKPENLLLDKDGYVKITDFGFAKRVIYKTYTLCGTPEYIAPEVLLNKGHGRGVDWWTLGILVYEMMVGQPPFIDEDPMGIYQQILIGKVSFPRFIERNARSLIKKLLVADLTKRYGCLKRGALDVNKHRFFQGVTFNDILAKKATGPVIPLVKDQYDTSNYEAYPDSIEEAPISVCTSGADLFASF